MKESGNVIAVDDEHQYVIKTPALDTDEWIMLSFPSSEVPLVSSIPCPSTLLRFPIVQMREGLIIAGRDADVGAR